MRHPWESRSIPLRKPRAEAESRFGKSRKGNGSAAEPRPIEQLPKLTQRKAFSAERAARQSDENLEGLLSLAILSKDKELGRILEALDDISETIKSELPDSPALSKVLRRAVLCAVKQSLVDRELRSLALTDDLTGLYNRRAFLAVAAQQLKFARRKQQGTLLFFADMDHLKDINDSYGHREGDLALIHCADALEQTFRDSDVVARIGGDEFAVLVLEASSEDEGLLLERLERNLTACGAEESRYGLSMSVGVARFDPAKPKSLAELMRQADRAMYEEKRRHPRFWASQP